MADSLLSHCDTPSDPDCAAATLLLNAMLEGALCTTSPSMLDTEAMKPPATAAKPAPDRVVDDDVDVGTFSHWFLFLIVYIMRRFMMLVHKSRADAFSDTAAADELHASMNTTSPRVATGSVVFVLTR